MNAATVSLKSAARLCAALLSTVLVSTAVQAQESAATVPTSFHGTYNMTFGSAQAGSPLTNGTAVTVIIAPGNLLCLGGYTLSNPVLRNGNAHEAIWKQTSLGVELALSSLVNGFNEINLASTSGTFYGQLNGSKVSTSTTGCGSTTPAPDLTKINDLFAQAQAKLAQYFPASANAVNQTLDGYVYRFYPSTNIYLAINNSDVYVMGGQFGNTPLKQGNIETVLSELGKITVDIPPVTSGNSTLVITGKVGTAGVLVDIGSITIDNLPMPSDGDVDKVRDAVREQYKNSGITGTINVTLISSSSSSIVFNIKFNGSVTQSGFTLTQNYDITYTYTKK